MAKKKKKNKKRSAIKKLVLFIACFYVVSSAIHQEITMRSQASEKAQLQEELARIQEKNNEIREQIKNAGTDEFVEKIAREKLGWVKEGEVLFILKGQNPQEADTRGVEVYADKQ